MISCNPSHSAQSLSEQNANTEYTPEECSSTIASASSPICLSETSSAASSADNAPLPRHIFYWADVSTTPYFVRMTIIDQIIGYVIPALPEVLSPLPESCMGLCIDTSRDCTVPCHPTNTKQVVIPLRANRHLVSPLEDQIRKDSQVLQQTSESVIYI